MKCNNCGYEIEKPNLKSCPLCGNKITHGVQSPDDKTVDEERMAVQTQSSSLIENETEGTVDLEISDEEELKFEETDTYPEPQPLRPEPPVISRQPIAPEPIRTPVHPANIYQEERITPEDPDEYLENGTYQPYPDEAEDETFYGDSSYPRPREKSSSSWVAIVVAAIVGILLGSLLYFSI